MRYVECSFNLSQPDPNKLYTYSVPDNIDVYEGDVVEVPAFNGKRRAKALVCNVHNVRPITVSKDIDIVPIYRVVLSDKNTFEKFVKRMKEKYTCFSK